MYGRGGECRRCREGINLAKTGGEAENAVFQKQGVNGSGSSGDYAGKGGALVNKARKASQQVA